MTRLKAAKTPSKASRHGKISAPALADDERMWAAIVSRDRTCDGQFFYSVATTGIYCRPTCTARRPLRHHVQFHPTPAAAERQGFRACKRCKPNEMTAPEPADLKLTRACRLIEASDTAPKLTDLANAVGLSPHHFHRIFTAHIGVTPKAYAEAERQRRIRANLQQENGTVTDAIFSSGFNSNSRFYSRATEFLGMTPKTYRKGGSETEIRYSIGTCSLGSILVAASPKGICALLLGDDPEELTEDLNKRFPRAKLIGGDKGFEATVAKAIDFVERPTAKHDLPLDIQGTAFQHKVWNALRRIPPGATASYTEIAQRIGHPKAVRAVGHACAANPIAIAIPCHRVLRSDGSLSGFRWGTDRKRTLLLRESKALKPGQE